MIKFTGFMHRMHGQIKQLARNTAHFEDGYPHMRMKKVEIAGHDDTVGSTKAVYHEMGRYGGGGV